METAEANASSCQIYRYECENDDDRMSMESLQKLARLQQEHFLHIYPWNGTCDARIRVIVYVALSGSLPSPVPSSPMLKKRKLKTQSPQSGHVVSSNGPTICGWMNVMVFNEDGGKQAYITELTARAAKDSKFKGVGSALVRSLEADAALEGFDFIYMHPLSNVVGFYAKQGYEYIHPVAHLMFKVIRKPPSEAFLSKQKLESGDIDEEVIDDIINELGSRHKKLMKAILKKDPDTKFEVLAIYEENNDIDDVVEWLHSMMPGPVSKKMT